jgi:hypothetical protein
VEHRTRNYCSLPILLIGVYRGCPGYIHGKLIGLCAIIVCMLQHLADESELNRKRRQLSAAGRSNHGHQHPVTAAASTSMLVSLRNCPNALLLARFFRTIGLDVAFGPEQGSSGVDIMGSNPTESEVRKALASIENFLLLDQGLLPGYFHFYGAPNSECIENIILVFKEIIAG